MTLEEFKKLKQRYEQFLDFEDDTDDNICSPDEDDPEDWCPEHW